MGLEVRARVCEQRETRGVRLGEAVERKRRDRSNDGLGLVALDALPASDGQPMISLITLTVILSVLLHGVTARPLARRYGEQSKNLDNGDAEPIPARRLRPRHLGEHSEHA